MMKKAKRIFTVVLLGVFVLLICFLLLSVSQIHVIDLKASAKIKAQDLYIKNRPKIKTYLETYKGRYLWAVNLKEIAQKAESIYLEGAVQVQRKFPNRLIVFFKEAEPFLLLLKQDRFFYSVSQEGRIGAKKNSLEGLNFPILRGKAFEKNSQLRRKAVKILLALPQTESSFSMENVSEILYNEDTGSLLFYLVSDYFIVELKNPPSLKQIRNIDFVLNYLRKQGRTKALIDAQLDKKIIVKRLNKG